MKSHQQLVWIAIAQACLIKAGDHPVQAEATVNVVLDAHRIARCRLGEDVKQYAQYLVGTLPLAEVVQ